MSFSINDLEQQPGCAMVVRPIRQVHFLCAAMARIFGKTLANQSLAYVEAGGFSIHPTQSGQAAVSSYELSLPETEILPLQFAKLS
jgi:hypothetical protein